MKKPLFLLTAVTALAYGLGGCAASPNHQPTKPAREGTPGTKPVPPQSGPATR